MSEVPAQPLMKMLATKTVSTKLGHMLAFKANEPRRVPWEAVGDAQAAGAVIVNDKGQPDEESAGRHQIFAVASDLRRSIFLRVIGDIVKKNDPAEFDAGGAPKLEALKMRCPLATDIAERDELYTIFKKAKHDPNVQIEWHHATEAAMAALDANTRAEIQAVAAKHKITKKEIETLDRQPVAEAKTRLVALLADYKGD